MRLELNQVCVARGGMAVLSDVTLTLTAGHALILRGPNGAGKTTLLRCIAGLQSPVSGQIIGAEGHVAYGAHADGLKAMLSVAENLRFWAAIYGNAAISDAMAAYHLAPLADQLVGTLSAGQKRRVGLARLMVTGRKLWVLDEPTVSLDTQAVNLFATALQTHLRGGGMAILATHIALGFEAQELDITRFAAQPDTIAADGAFL